MKKLILIVLIALLGVSCKENSKKISNENGLEHIAESNVEP